MNLREYYHLTKDTFTIKPDEDSGVYFGGAELEQKIKRRIVRDFNQERAVPKFMIHAPYGGGKTHTLRRIEHELDTDPRLRDGMPTVRPLRYDLAPIRSKERWATVHMRIMNAIGQEAVRDAVASVLASPDQASDPLPYLQQEGVLRYGETAIRASQAQIFRNLLFGGRQATLSWEWLRGRKLTVDEMQMLGTQANLVEPADLVHSLLNVASLVLRGTGDKLLLLVDEGEALGNLSSADSLHEFRYALRRLFDDDNDVLGLIIAYQHVPGIDRVPDVLEYDAIRRRVGYEAGYIDLTGHLGVPENARIFITDLLAHLVDQGAAAATIDEQGLNTQREFFPFEEEAVDLVAEWVTADPQHSLPSQIITKMSDAVVDTWIERDPASDHRRLVDEPTVSTILYEP